MRNQLFINNFQKGSKENPNIGMGTLVGIDTYSKKGVARLAKKSTTITTGFTSYPTFVDFSSSGNYIWVQCADGSVLYSSDGGSNFQATNTAFPVAGHGNGLIFFQNYMFAFIDTKVYYWKDTAGASGADPTAGAWVDWTTTKSLGTLQNFVTDPITGLHFPFLFPNNRGVYFGNGGAGGTSNAVTTGSGASSTVGFFGQVGQTTFNPAGTINVDFLWNNGILQLPSSTWTVGTINFLPPTNLAIGLHMYNNPAQGADLITWDTISTNKFNPPLRIYSDINSTDTGTITAGIKQLWNRNQVLYAVTGGNHSIYETNGSSFNLLEDIGLYSSIRTAAGAESDYPVFFNSFPSAITTIGNKILTGVAPMANNSTSNYPPSSNGFFPVGVWSIAFNPDGSHSTQCEHVIPLGNSTVSPTGSGNYSKITCLKPIGIDSGSNSTGKLLIGFAFKNDALGETFGVSIVDLYNYIDNIEYTAIESELFEIGTFLKPTTINNIEVNFVKKLKTGQTFDLAYRTGLENSWTNIPYEGVATVTGDNTKNSYAYTLNSIGPVQFIQLRVRMATDSGNAKDSPELRTVVLQ